MTPSPDEQRLQHIRDYCLKIQHALDRFDLTWDSFKDDAHCDNALLEKGAD